MQLERFKWYLANKITTELARTCPVDTGELKLSIDFVITGNKIQIMMAKHGWYVEYGTAPHIIRPKNAKALHWKGTGTGPRGGKVTTDVFAKEVHHPGTSPQPFIRPMFHTKFNKFVEEAKKYAFGGTA